MIDKKVLVAYFSATGITAKLAQKLSETLKADIFEIKPEYPYSNDDLDWTNKLSRSSIEMSDKRTRPEIASTLDNMNEYDVIFIGFPIWWYREPSIIDTFMESYDFQDKVIIPFATSGGSSIGDSSGHMQELAPLAKVNKGRRFPNNVNKEELKQWAKNWL